MKKMLTLIAATAIVGGLSLKGLTNASQPPVAHTGAPGEMNCAHCHGNLNVGTGSVALLAPPLNYVPGTSYTLQVKVTDITKSRFGFEMVALTGSNAQAGTFTLTSTTNTALLVNGTKRYVSHKNANTNSLWSVTWTAPATNVGPVTFYMAGNAANGNGSDSGDNIYTSSFVLNPAITTGIQEDKNGFISVYPNPASDKMSFKFSEEITGVKVLDLKGREVSVNKNAASEKQILVSQLPNGIYFLKLDSEKSSLVKKFVVQH